MAYINGINNNYSSANSIYKNRNIISGLASGMDTESMIENAVSGYKMKINKMIQSRTKVEWRQEGYRSIIEKMSSFSDKYMSYASPTNLMSGSFFNSAIKMSTTGTYKDKVSASGQTSSNIQILGVKQLAQAAQYKVSGLGGGSSSTPSVSGGTIELDKVIEVSNISGSLSVSYGNKKVDISFSKDEVFKTPQEFAEAINKKLGEQNLAVGESTYKASDKIKAEVNSEGNIEFKLAESGDTNSVGVVGASGDLKKVFEIENKTDFNKDQVTTINMKDKKLFDDSQKAGDYLSGKTLTINVDGKSREITLPKFDPAGNNQNGTFADLEGLKKSIQEQADKAFGTGKVTVDLNDKKDGLKFSAKQGSTLILEGDAVKVLGFEKDASTFVDTRKNLGDVFGDKLFEGLAQSKAEGKVTFRKGQNGAADYYVDEEGYRVVKAKDASGKETDEWVRVDDKGNALYDLTINGERVGSFNKDTQMETVLNKINGNSKASVKVSYSRTTDEFTFTAKESGTIGKVSMGDDLASKMFGKVEDHPDNYTEGKDAIFSMKVNNTEMVDVERNSNDFNIDGLNIKLEGTFNYKNTAPEGQDPTYELDKTAAAADSVSFKADADPDKIVDAVKEMVKDYNEMVTELKNAFSNLPVQNGKGKYYEPLTDKDREGMSESAIKAHEEKAKQGILFADRDLSALYDQLRQAISPAGQDGADMRAIGITVEYKGGLSTLKLDEDALRQAIKATPDKVKDVFTKSKENGASSDGLMQAIKKPLDMYGKVHGDKGILVEKAGSPLSPTSIYTNVMQQEINRWNAQIEKMESKMNSQIDRYTRQFSQMEQMIAQMNSQSSALAGMMGGF